MPNDFIDPYETNSPQPEKSPMQGGAFVDPYQQEATQEQETANDGGYISSIFPVRVSEKGDYTFDPDAGVLGAAKRAFMLPSQVYKGEVDPTTPEGMARATEAAGFMTPMGAASRVRGSMFAPESAYKDVVQQAPTRQALKEATDEAYETARSLGIEYKPQAMKKWADDMANTLNERGQIAENYPQLHALISKLQNIPEGATSVRLESVDALYKELGKLGANKDEGPAAALAQRALDYFHETLDPSAVVAGTATPQQAAKLLKEGRGNAAAGFRSDRVTGLEKTASRRAAAANSGQNTDNAIRQRLTTLIESQKGSRGLSKDEKQAIDDIIYGRPTKNALRYFGNLLGGGGGMAQALLIGGGGGAGAALGGAPGAMIGAMLPGAIGSVAKGAANRMTARELKELDDLIRSRSPLAQNRPALPQAYAPSIPQETMAKALLSKPTQLTPEELEFMSRGGI